MQYFLLNWMMIHQWTTTDRLPAASKVNFFSFTDSNRSVWLWFSKFRHFNFDLSYLLIPPKKKFHIVPRRLGCGSTTNSVRISWKVTNYLNGTKTIRSFKVDILRKCKMFEFGATGGCGISKEIALLNFFCYCRPKYLLWEIQTS